MPTQFKDLCLDAHDHQALADWWCDAMGYIRHLEQGERRPPEKSVPIVDPTGRGPLIWVIPVPEEKVVKNRMHIDVWGDADELIARGASMVLPKGDDRWWDVLADPEGNEFCVFAPAVGETRQVSAASNRFAIQARARAARGRRARRRDRAPRGSGPIRGGGAPPPIA